MKRILLLLVLAVSACVAQTNVPPFSIDGGTVLSNSSLVAQTNLVNTFSSPQYFVGGAGVPNIGGAPSQFVAEALRDYKDMVFLNVSDSTAFSYGASNYPTIAVQRWYLYWVQIMAPLFPTYTVKYCQWNYGINDNGPNPGTAYNACVTIQTGSGSHTIWFYNASFPGAAFTDFDFGRYDIAIRAVNPDVVNISLGHNSSQVAPTSWLPAYLKLHDRISHDFPNVGMITTLQNKTYSPYLYYLMTPQKVTVIEQGARARGDTIFNAYQAFADQPNVTTCLISFTDSDPNLRGLHPTSPSNVPGGCTENGSHFWAVEFSKLFQFSRYNPITGQQPKSVLDTQQENLVANGNFNAFLGATPDNCSAIGTGATTTQDTTHVVTANGYSVLVQATAGNQGYMLCNLDPTIVAGQTVTSTALVYVPTGNSSIQQGRIGLADNTGADTSEYTQNSQFGGWSYNTVTRAFPVGIGQANVRIYGDADTTYGGSASVAWVCVTIGTNPCFVPPPQQPGTFYSNNAAAQLRIGMQAINNTRATNAVRVQNSPLIMFGGSVYDTGTTSAKHSLFALFDAPTSNNPATHCAQLRDYLGTSDTIVWTLRFSWCGDGSFTTTGNLVTGANVAPSSAGAGQVGTGTFPFSTAYFGSSASIFGQLDFSLMTGQRDLKFPDISDTLTTKTSTDTLTNKTLISSNDNNTVTLFPCNGQAGHQGPLTSVAGTGADVAMYTCSIPANFLQAAKGLRIKTGWNKATGTNSLTIKIKIDSTAILTVTHGTGNANGVATLEIFNNTGVQNAQNINAQYLVSTAWASLFTTSALDFTGTRSLTITQNVASPDTTIPEFLDVEIVK